MICSINSIDEIIFISNKDKVGEISFHFSSDLEKMLEIIKQYKDKRIVIDVDLGVFDADDLDVAKMLHNAYENIVFRADNSHTAKMLKDNSLPFFVSKLLGTAYSFDAVVFLCQSGLTDIYVSGELGFSLDKVRNITQKYGTKIRVIPNMAQYSGFSGKTEVKVEPLTSFWIRPEDLHLYEDLIDVVEFAGEDKIQEILYEIYFLEQKYRGNLSILIAGMCDLDNANLPKQFTVCRIDCDKKCHFDRCHKCFKYRALAELIEEKKLEIESQ